MRDASRVWILMGSESDRPTMAKAAEVLRDFGLSSRTCVASAHRSPGLLARLLKESEEEAQVYIAGAGGAAHLAGAVASLTIKPVIGVPLSTKMGGIDSLLSTVQMPRGVPVATVAVDGAQNAALLAVEMLALSDAGLRRRLREYRERLARGHPETALGSETSDSEPSRSGPRRAYRAEVCKPRIAKTQARSRSRSPKVGLGRTSEEIEALAEAPPVAR